MEFDTFAEGFEKGGELPEVDAGLLAESAKPLAQVPQIRWGQRLQLSESHSDSQESCVGRCNEVWA